MSYDHQRYVHVHGHVVIRGTCLWSCDHLCMVMWSSDVHGHVVIRGTCAWSCGHQRYMCMVMWSSEVHVHGHVVIRTCAGHVIIRGTCA